MSDVVEFEREAVRLHLKENFPSCPKEFRRLFLKRVLRKSWAKVTLPEAVGIVVTTFARHNLTAYDRMLRVPGMTREEARLIVREELRDLLARWRSPKDVEGEGQSAKGDAT